MTGIWKQLFFYPGFLLQTLMIQKREGEGLETMFYSSLPLPHAHEHSDIYCNFACEMTSIFNAFLMASFVTTRLLLD